MRYTRGIGCVRSRDVLIGIEFRGKYTSERSLTSAVSKGPLVAVLACVVGGISSRHSCADDSLTVHEYIGT